jgi:hypothetical protein
MQTKWTSSVSAHDDLPSIPHRGDPYLVIHDDERRKAAAAAAIARKNLEELLLPQ